MSDCEIFPTHQRFLSDGRYMQLPVKTGAEKVSLLFGLPGVQDSYSAEIELGTFSDCDFIGCVPSPVPPGAWLDTSISDGRRAMIRFSDTLPDAPDGRYSQERPALHFSGGCGWLSDPNGLFYADGNYHLFYQHNPFGVNWVGENIHWGHAISSDLLHWHTLPPMLAPDRSGSVYSGCAVVDTENRSGLGSGKTPPVLLFYTATSKHASVQSMAYSCDGGRSFVKYAGNPIIQTRSDARDPNIFFDTAHDCFVMVLYNGDNEETQRNSFSFYTSRDLLSWRLDGVCDMGVRECPGLYRLRSESENTEKTVFHAAAGTYFIGHLNGSVFQPETGPLQYFVHSSDEEPPWDGHAYAGQCFNNTPDGRCIFIAWLRPFGLIKHPFLSCAMTLPVELTLRRFPEGELVAVQPICELEALRTEPGRYFAECSTSVPLPPEMKTGNGVIAWEILGKLPPIGRTEFSAGGIPWCYDASNRTLRTRGLTCTLPPDADGRFRLFFDFGGMELFAADGRLWLPHTIVADPIAPVLEVRTGHLVDITIYHLASVLPSE